MSRVALVLGIWISTIALWLFSTHWVRRAPDSPSGFRRTTLILVIPLVGAAVVSFIIHGESSLPHLIMLSAAGLLAGLAWLSTGKGAPEAVGEPLEAAAASPEYRGVYYASAQRAGSRTRWYPWDDAGTLRLQDELLVFAGGKGTIELRNPISIGLRSQVWSPLPYAIVLLVTLVSMFWVAFLAGVGPLVAVFATWGLFAGYAYLVNRADKWLVVQGMRPGVGPEICYFHIGTLGQAIARSQREMAALAVLVGSVEPALPADAQGS